MIAVVSPLSSILTVDDLEKKLLDLGCKKIDGKRNKNDMPLANAKWPSFHCP